MFSKVISVLVVFALTAGCAAIPAYERPQIPLAVSWSEDTEFQQDERKRAADIAWKDYFRSEPLQKLIVRTLDNNRDMRIAVLNIQAAMAAYRIQKTESLPSVDGSASVTRANVPDNASATGAEYGYTSAGVSIGITSYELDLFGRVQSLKQKALEKYLATEEAKSAVRISLISETANAYLAYLADKKQLILAENTLETSMKTYELVKKTFDLGLGSELAVVQADTSVQSAKAAVQQYKRITAQDRNAIELLAGTNVSDLLDTDETIDTVDVMGGLPVGLSSEVLLARPDIRQAEHMLKAANADIGAARASLYPRIMLTGSVGAASADLDNLFEAGSVTAWSFTPSVTIPIFNRGRLKASLETAEVNEKIAVAQYEQSLQRAFREVADQLAARKTFEKQLEAQTALVDSGRRAYELSDIRFRGGVDSFLPVLDSQRALFSAEQAAVSVKQQYLSNLVTLYKVLGGGQL
jgi:multidrug efflux system outer membrane protein